MVHHLAAEVGEGLLLLGREVGGSPALKVRELDAGAVVVFVVVKDCHW